MSDHHEPETKFLFTGASFQTILAEMNEYAGDPTVRLKLKKGHGDHWFAQVCTDAWGGGDTNDSIVCPGSPLC